LIALTPQLSVNLTRNTGQRTLTAEPHIVHRGRTTLVVVGDTFDDPRRLIARLATNQLAPAAPPAEARSREE
jgi:acyl-coenzyme A thioesterase PaaI-like protein